MDHWDHSSLIFCLSDWMEKYISSELFSIFITFICRYSIKNYSAPPNLSPKSKGSPLSFFLILADMISQTWTRKSKNNVTLDFYLNLFHILRNIRRLEHQPKTYQNNFTNYKVTSKTLNIKGHVLGWGVIHVLLVNWDSEMSL